jgi:hypothetical protein
MRYGVSLPAHDVFRSSKPLRGQPQDFEIASRRMGDYDRRARWRRVWSFLAMVGCAHGMKSGNQISNQWPTPFHRQSIHTDARK